MAILNDGFKTLATLASGAIELAEKELTPPGMSGGGAIDTTTMRNTAWRTAAPKSLKSLTPVTGVFAYDPQVYTSLLAQINVNQLITVTFPDGDTVAFWGYPDEFTPASSVEGEQPTASITFVPTLVNDSGVETAPAHTASV